MEPMMNNSLDRLIFHCKNLGIPYSRHDTVWITAIKVVVAGGGDDAVIRKSRRSLNQAMVAVDRMETMGLLKPYAKENTDEQPDHDIPQPPAPDTDRRW